VAGRGNQGKRRRLQYGSKKRKHKKQQFQILLWDRTRGKKKPAERKSKTQIEDGVSILAGTWNQGRKKKSVAG